ncbi:DUF1697 domain-containing protein [Brevibacillus dissolubilis]|uniref:DUF1697 domain-containing protein n=1 Tax=Brevibacillus dissolubilis TaxID=1844116 RepID=UPI001116D801|nr:DUF1697 domain-containing protein [Brevibacillus dissolubilis]
MTIHIALLRGINVGGKNIIKMTDLKHTLESIGLTHVQTYIQSGNVLFESPEEEAPLRHRIEQAIEQTFGFPVPVVLRTADELKKTAHSCPFSAEEVSQAESTATGESLHVAFLLDVPSSTSIERLNAAQSQSEEYRLVGRDAYLLFRQSIRNSKLATNLQKLDVPATVRNWKTVNKLVTLATAMEI